MLDIRISPPFLLHSPSPSDHTSPSSRDTTPATPNNSAGPLPGKQPGFATLPVLSRHSFNRANFEVDSSLVTPDFDETTFPLFGASPGDRSMAVAAAPDRNFNNREASTATRGNQPSGLTAGLKREDSGENTKYRAPTMEFHRPSLAVPESSDMSRFENGARPISMKGRAMDKRRESLAQSIGMGMSWGGASVGSWIRDE